MTDYAADWFAKLSEENFDRITGQWQALCSSNREESPYRIERRSLPAPIWAGRGLTEQGMQAWEALQEELQTRLVERPICIYVHIPFCSSHCSFCDCYAFALKRHCEDQTNAYSLCLTNEIRSWARQGSLHKRPVTTVHLGGGTPVMLGMQNLERLVGDIRANFNVDADTEWALETTSSSLDDETMTCLHGLGFRRLHIGVQSLQDDVRAAIGRREGGSAVMERIKKAISLGWIVSVDMIVGLPFQTPQGLVDDLDCLIESGVEGFSIYELQRSRINRHFIEKYNLNQKPAIERYLLFQLAFQTLLSRGYSLNVFNHLAKGRDRNLYFTFPQRDEDLLALGTIADGVFNNYHYRHPEYLPYLKGSPLQTPFLEGGIRRTAAEDRMHELEVQILGGQIDRQTFTRVLGRNVADWLINGWLDYRIIENRELENHFVLTPNGSWFAGQMLQEIRSNQGNL